MPWEHCGNTLLDDQACACGYTKAQWTVELDVTRQFQVKAKARSKPYLKLLMLDGKEQEVGGVAYSVDLPDGTQVEGTLDDFGYAKVNSPKGTCTVRFPALADDVWKPLDDGASPPQAGAFSCQGGDGSLHRFGLAPVVVTLKDADGKPVAGRTVRIQQADGSVKEGTSDANGAATVHGVVRGIKVAVKDLALKDWAPA